MDVSRRQVSLLCSPLLLVTLMSGCVSIEGPGAVYVITPPSASLAKAQTMPLGLVVVPAIVREDGEWVPRGYAVLSDEHLESLVGWTHLADLFDGRYPWGWGWFDCRECEWLLREWRNWPAELEEERLRFEEAVERFRARAQKLVGRSRHLDEHSNSHRSLPARLLRVVVDAASKDGTTFSLQSPTTGKPGLLVAKISRGARTLVLRFLVFGSVWSREPLPSQGWLVLYSPKDSEILDAGGKSISLSGDLLADRVGSDVMAALRKLESEVATAFQTQEGRRRLSIPDDSRFRCNETTTPLGKGTVRTLLISRQD